MSDQEPIDNDDAANGEEPTHKEFKPGNGTLYIMRERDHLTGDHFDYFKIGIVRGDKDVVDREKQHRTGNPRGITTVREWQTPNVQAIETALHNRFAAHRVSSGEWFHLPGDLLDIVISSAEALVAQSTSVLAAREAAHNAKNSEHNAPPKVATEILKDVARMKADLELAHAAVDKHAKAVRAELMKVIDGNKEFLFLLKESQRAKSTTWDSTSFKRKYPQLHAKYVTQKFSWVTQWPIEGELPSTYSDLEVPVSSDPIVLHQAHLEAWSTKSDLEWQISLLNDSLLAACGDAGAIDGILVWEQKSRNFFDKKLCEQEQPEKYGEFVGEKPASVTYSPAEWASYKLA